MNTSHRRFVAHIDVLGMSALVERNAEKAWQLLSDLVSVREEVHKVQIDFLDTAERISAEEKIRSVTFSDTIILFTKGDTIADLRSITILTTELLNKALNLYIPIRAGLAVGTFFFNEKKSMYAGPALIEAYRIGEEAQWIGICTTEEIYMRSKAALFQSGKADVVIPTNIPLKKGTREGYAVNWPALMTNSIKAPNPVSGKEIYQAFSQYFGDWEMLDVSVQTKYVYTAQFLNEHRTHD